MPLPFADGACSLACHKLTILEHILSVQRNHEMSLVVLAVAGTGEMNQLVVFRDHQYATAIHFAVFVLVDQVVTIAPQRGVVS